VIGGSDSGAPSAHHERLHRFPHTGRGSVYGRPVGLCGNRSPPSPFVPIAPPPRFSVRENAILGDARGVAAILSAIFVTDGAAGGNLAVFVL